MASNKVVVTFACIAGTVTVIVAGSLLYRTLSRDRWEVFHAADCVKRLDDADRIKSSDPLAAYRIYEEVLSEAAQHELSEKPRVARADRSHL